MDFNFLQTLIGGLLGGGLISFIQFLIQRRDVKLEKKDEKKNEILYAISQLDSKIMSLEQKIDLVDRKGEEREAKGEKREATHTRARILRFDDELREKRLHSVEHFQEILRDCDNYESYCREHADYENSYAVDAISNIKKVFRQCKDDNNFI